MKYPLKALMPLDAKGKHMSDGAWERTQKIMAGFELKHATQIRKSLVEEKGA